MLAKPGIGQDVRKMKPPQVDQLSITIPSVPSLIHSRPPSEPSSPARRLTGDRGVLPPVPKRMLEPYSLHGNYFLILFIKLGYLK